MSEARESSEKKKRKRTTERLLDWKNQDPAILRELAEEWSARLTSTAAKEELQPADAADVGQEAMLAALTRPAGWKPKGKLRSWMCGTARNMAKDVAAGIARSPRTGAEAPSEGGDPDGEAGGDGDASHDALADAARSREDGPRTAALRRERVLAAKASLDTLGARERAAVEHLHFGGLKLDQAAAVMGKPAKSVWRWAQSGLAKLRESLAGLE